VHRAQRMLEGYARQMGALRLIARGVSPQIAAPVLVEELDLATPEKQAANALGMLPLFLLMTVFVGGMHLAIDSTAGERERGSLEPLLLNPVTRTAIVAGKWVAAVLMTLLAVVVSLSGFLVALSRVPLQDLGVKVHLGPVEVATLLGILVPLMLAAAGLQMLLATFARTFKEAQTYVSLLTFIPMLPGVAITLHPIKSVGWMMMVPALGQTLLVTDVLRGEGVPVAMLLLAGAGALAAAAVCVSVTIRLFGQERIVFGR
jgi:sodium transport system permease protein